MKMEGCLCRHKNLLFVFSCRKPLHLIGGKNRINHLPFAKFIRHFL